MEYTKVPNLFFELMADMDKSEQSVVLFVVRKTLGYRKEWDRISLSQFQEGAGLNRPSCAKGIQAAIDRGVIQRRGNKNSYEYALTEWFKNGSKSEPIPDSETVGNGSKSEPIIGSKSEPITENGSKSEPKTVQKVNTQKKERKLPVAAALSFSQNGHSASKNFFAEYERIWGKAATTKARRDEVEAWTHRVTLDEWRYALDESASYNQIGNWRYLERILNRVESEGLPALEIQSASAPASVNFSVDDILR